MIPFGTPRRHQAQCGSTNDLAREWARDPADPAPSGALVTADFQTRGRGRRGRQWQAPTGESALMSFVYRLPPGAEVGQLGLVVALAVADAVATLACLEPRIKWPNDILLDGRKATGILVEAAHTKEPTPAQAPSPPETGGGRGEDTPVETLLAAPSYLNSSPLRFGDGGEERRMSERAGRGSFAILGIGINVNQEWFDGGEEFVYPPTSLRLETGQAFEREAVITAIGLALSWWEDRWRQEGFLPIVKECRSRLAVGAWVRQGENRAELMGLDPNGAAYVRLSDGTFGHWSTVD